MTSNICKRPLDLSNFKMLFLVFAFLSKGEVSGQQLFTAPIDTPIHLAGTFGELRLNHFHSGIDFRTNGKEGMPVNSSAKGWISRVKVSPVGFGNVLYIDDYQGHTLVYAHLHNFIGPVFSYIDSAQKASQSFEVELFPDSGRFTYEQGELLGLSGNSGGSEGPHLHFEIRDRLTQEPLNPLLFNFNYKDTVAPDLKAFTIYTRRGRRIIPVNNVEINSPSDSICNLETEIKEIYLGVLANDPDLLNENGVYSIKLSMDDSILFDFSFNKFNFDETRYANAHADFIKYKGTSERIHRLYKLPGDSSSVFLNSGDGRILLIDTLPHILKIECSDISGNHTILLVEIKRVGESSTIAFSKGDQIIPFGQNWDFIAPDGLKISIPNGALYQDEYFSYKGAVENVSYLSSVFSVLENLTISLHKQGKLSITFSKLSAINKGKYVIARLDVSGKIREVILPDSVTEDELEGRFRVGGRYTATIDTSPPVIQEIYSELDPVDSLVYESCIVKDDLSGLKSYNVFINTAWVVASYDAKKDKISWQKNFAKMGPDLFKIQLTDRCNNTVELFFAE